VKFGPNIATNGLVLALDAANPRSFRGEPTENLVPTSGMRLCSTAFTRNSSHVETWTYSRETNVFGRANVTKATITPTGTTAQPYADWGFAAYKTGGSEIGDVYTVSFDFKVVEGTTTPTLNTVYANGYKTPDSSGAASLGTQYFKDLGDGWTRYSRSATITVAGNTWWRFGMNSNNNPTTVYVDNFQVELKSSSTRFVDGTRGTTVATGGGWADLSGNAYHGEILNGTTTDSDETIQGTLEFDGTNDYVSLGDLDLVTGAFSINVWFKGNPSQTGTYAALVSKDDAGNFGNFNMGGDSGNNYVRFGFSGTNGQKEVSNSSYYDLKANTWVNYCGTWDGSSTLKLYRNGVVIDTNSSANGTLILNNNNLIIGDRTATDGFFGGKISLVQIYTKELTSNEVLKNYNATKGRFGL